MTKIRILKHPEIGDPSNVTLPVVVEGVMYHDYERRVIGYDVPYDELARVGYVFTEHEMDIIGTLYFSLRRGECDIPI